MAALAFGEEIGIGHQHPLALEAFERQGQFAFLQGVGSGQQALDGGHALVVNAGPYQLAGADDVLELFTHVKGQCKVQRHIVALHQRARVHRDQRHQNALAMGNDLLLAAHIPVHDAQRQHRAHGQTHPLQAALWRCWRRACACMCIGCAAQRPQTGQQQHANQRQAQALGGQRPAQVVVELGQRDQRQQRAEHRNAPARRQQGARCHQADDGQTGAEPRGQRQHGTGQQQAVLALAVGGATGAPLPRQHPGRQRHHQDGQCAPGREGPGDKVATVFPEDRPGHIAGGDMADQHTDDGRIGKGRPAWLGPALRRLGQAGGLGTQPQAPEQGGQQCIELQRQHRWQPGLQRHQADHHGHAPAQAHQRLDPAHLRQRGTQHQHQRR